MSIDVLYAGYKADELTRAERDINYRAEWYALRKVERLEKALRNARTQLRLTPAPEAR